MEQINARMHVAPLALHTTTLRRRFMDWASAAAGRENTTTARETCRIFDVLHTQHNRYQTLLDWLIMSPYKDKLPAGVPDGVIVAHKVGDLPNVEHDAGIVYAPSGPFMVALLASGLSDEQRGRATLAEASKRIYDVMTAPGV